MKRLGDTLKKLKNLELLELGLYKNGLGGNL